MQTTKRSLVAVGVAAVTFGATPALAGSLSEDTATFAFDDTQKIAATEDVASLSETEMKETEGQFAFTALGATVAFAGAWTSTYLAQDFSTQTATSTPLGSMAYNGVSAATDAATGNYAGVAETIASPHTNAYGGW